jgi:hypothetical protein
LQIISDRFELELDVNPFETANSCDRSLSSTGELINKLQISTIKEQIRDL